MRLLGLTLQQLSRSTLTMSFTPAFKYINAQELAEIVKKNDPKAVQVIDVRDDDFVGEHIFCVLNDLADLCLGGNIKGAVNSPSESFTQNVTELVKQYDEGEFGGTVNPALTDLFPNSAQSCLP
jgi:3-mercaptopyruvate sulfurtransferase SseA